MLKKSVDEPRVDPRARRRACRPRTALLAGLVLGVAVMIGIAGVLAWREKEQAYETKLMAMPRGDARLRTPCRARRRSATRAQRRGISGRSSRSLGRDPPLQLHAHQIEARRVEPARLPERKSA